MNKMKVKEAVCGTCIEKGRTHRKKKQEKFGKRVGNVTERKT